MSTTPSIPSVAARTARSCDRAASSHGTVGPTTAVVPRSARTSPARAERVPVDGASSRASPSGTPGTSSVGWRVRGSRAVTACETCDSGSSTALSAVGGSQSARSAAATTASAAAPVTRARASRSRLRCRTRPVLSSSSVWPAALEAESSSM